MAEPLGGALWRTPKAWALRRSRTGCPICRRRHPRDVVATLPASWVTAPRQAPLPGYVAVVARQHVVEPLELPPSAGHAFWDDVMLVAKCVADLFSPVKMNYELHGNTVPHLHVHIYPRYRDDPYVGGPIDPRRAREKDRRRRRTRGVLAFRGAWPAPDRERFLRRPRVAAEGSRAGPGHAPPRRSEGDARGADRSRGDADERDGRDILEIDGLPDWRSHRVRPRHPLESVDHLAVRPERLLPEFLAALRAADPRPRAFRVLLVQRPEELGHLECDLLRLRLGAVETFHLAEEVRVQVDLGSLRDAVEAVRLQSHVEPLPVVKGLECDQVEGLALGSVPEGDHRRLDRRERHPPRKRGLHRTPHAPYATFADTSE